MPSFTVESSKPPITLTSARGITITVDRSVTTSSGGGSGTVTDVTATSPIVVSGVSTVAPVKEVVGKSLLNDKFPAPSVFKN